MNTYRILALAAPGRDVPWAASLARELGIPHLDIADLIRREAALKDALLDQDFLDDRLVMELIGRSIAGCGPEGFVVSGVPLGPLVAVVAREHRATHVVGALGGLPEALRKPIADLQTPTLVVPAEGDALRDILSFLR